MRCTYTTDNPHSLREQVWNSKEQEKKLGVLEEFLKWSE